jgi:hypothetical protein
MSGETEKDVSGLTTDTLKLWVESEIASLRREIKDLRRTMETGFAVSEKAVTAALESVDKAVLKKETETEKRFEGVNEFRAQQADMIAQFMTRAEYAAKHEALEQQVDALKERLDQTQGRAGGVSALYGWATSGILLIIAVVVFANQIYGR